MGVGNGTIRKSTKFFFKKPARSELGLVSTILPSHELAPDGHLASIRTRDLDPWLVLELEVYDMPRSVYSTRLVY